MTSIGSAFSLGLFFFFYFWRLGVSGNARVCKTLSAQFSPSQKKKDPQDKKKNTELTIKIRDI